MNCRYFWTVVSSFCSSARVSGRFSLRLREDKLTVLECEVVDGELNIAFVAKRCWVACKEEGVG